MYTLPSLNNTTEKHVVLKTKFQIYIDIKLNYLYEI